MTEIRALSAFTPQNRSGIRYVLTDIDDTLTTHGRLPAAAYAAHRQSSRMGWSLDGHLVAVRSGWWSRYWRFAEIDKLQALRLSRSPLDHACGTASLWLDTAGANGIAAPLALRFVPEAEARDAFERLSLALARRRLRW